MSHVLMVPRMGNFILFTRKVCKIIKIHSVEQNLEDPLTRTKVNTKSLTEPIPDLHSSLYYNFLQKNLFKKIHKSEEKISLITLGKIYIFYLKVISLINFFFQSI